MELESIDKYIHMTKLAQGVEVMFAGQPCLKITEGLDSYVWAIYPVFAKLTYGASIFEDVPYCSETFETMEEAIADGLARLHSLGAFVGEVDLPEDTYAESGVNESVEDLATKLEITEETLDSILQDCRAYATNHSTSIMEAHDLSLGLYESILAEADFSGVNADAKRQGKTHEQMAAEHRKYAANMRRVGQAGLAGRSEALAKEHDAAAKVNEETLDEAIDKDHPIVKEYSALKKEHDIKSLRSLIGNQSRVKDTNEFKSKDHAISHYLRAKHGNKKFAAAFGLNEDTLDEAKALSGDAYWKSKEDAAAEAKAKADRASAGIKEPEKKGRGKPTLGATVDEMKDRMRENIAGGKRPHTGFDRNEKLRILRSGAMEHPEFAGTHVKAAGRPVGTTKAAAIEKKKAEPTAFSMWAGLGKK